MHRQRGIGAVLAVLVALVCAAPAAAAPPANDDFADAETLTGEDPSAFGNVGEATTEPGEPVHGPGLTTTVWYSWQAPVSRWVTVLRCGGPVNAVEAVYTGSAVDALTLVSRTSVGAGGGCGYAPEWQASFRAVAGTTYRIAVAAEGGANNFQLSFDESQPRFNDTLANSDWLGGTDDLAEGHNVGATTEPREVVPAGSGGATVWYSWTAPSDGVAELSTCGSSFDARVAAYVGDSPASLMRVGETSPGFEWDCDFLPHLRVGTTAGVTYRFAVDGAGAPGGQVAAGRIFMRLQVTPNYPQNDSFGTPYELVGVPGRVWNWDLPTDGTTKEFGEPAHAGDAGGSSLWFRFVPRESGVVEIDTCASDFDTLLAAYTGDSVRALTPVAANDDSVGPACPGTNRSALRFHVSAGVVYRVAADGKGGAEGKLAIANRLIPDSQLTPPNTFITRVKLDPKRRLSRFFFRSNKLGSRFFCQLDRGPRRRCRSPVTFTKLAAGMHVLRVTAEDFAGNVDPSPRVRRFRVQPPPPPGAS